MKTFNVVGRVINSQTKQGVAGLKVEAWDKDLIVDDLLGTSVTNEQGFFQMDFSESSIRDLGFIEPKPDLFFKLFLADELVASTENSVLWNVSSEKKEIVIEVMPEIAQLNASGLKIPEIERANFRALLLTNPNYFGNLAASKFQAIKLKKFETSYEELKCVGYNPHLKQLHAVVHVKKDFGYLGGICSAGSTEYVRFYIDWNNDGNWIDVGLARFTAFDLPGDKPLEYSVTLDIDPKERDCTIENLTKVRAILSWNDQPTPGDPSYVPVWGNVVEASIQIDTIVGKSVKLSEWLKMGTATIPESVLQNLEPGQSVLMAKPLELSVGDLANAYKDKGVPAHRFAFAKINKLLTKPVVASVAHLELAEVLSSFDIQISAIVQALASTDGDTHYEELKCVGYDSQRRHLTGILTVKRPYGYLGNLCKKGSMQYVAFWEWDEIEVTWVYLGTAVLNTHDIQSIPKEGLQYAVSLSADFSKRRRPCTKGPSEARIRAILSWQDPPPPHNPDWVPKWGNREETRIHIKPGPKPNEKNIPYIETIGDIDVCSINQSTGLATGEGIVAYFEADRSPFARTLTVTGYIDNPPEGVMEGTASPLKYMISVRPYDLAGSQPWQPLNNDFEVWVREEIDLNPPVHKKIIQKIDPVDGYYTYLEDPGAPHERHYVIPVLAKWHTSQPHTGLWEIQIKAKMASGSIVDGGVLVCAADKSTRSIVKVRLDNKEPEVLIGLSGYQRGLDPTVHLIGTGTRPDESPEKCGKFLIGDVLHGTYSVADEHFGQLTLTVTPGGPAHNAEVNPSERHFDIVPTTGESGGWTLDTKNMEPCGYTVRLWARDRAIVNSGYIGLWSYDDAGFCLEKP
jgi:hypothetical protein